MDVGALDRVRDEVRHRLFRSSEPAAPSRVPDLGARYDVLHPLGRGAASIVWEVEHTGTGRRLAAKVLSVDDAYDGTIAKRLVLEARATGGIRHPNVIEVIDTGVAADGKPFLVMELLVGRTLQQLLRDEGPLPWDRAARILRQIAAGLDAAHRIGVVHRDLKPANVMLVDESTDDVRCKVLDFGLARWQQLDEVCSRLTRSGAVFGTPSYMSPEQINRGEVDARSDIYALGCLAYELVSGRPPFEGTSIGEVLYQQLFEHPRAPLPVDTSSSRAAVAWIRRCMRKRPSLRFYDMGAVVAALDDVFAGRGPVVVPEEPLIPGSSASMVMRFAAPQRDHWIIGTIMVAVATIAAAAVVPSRRPTAELSLAMSRLELVAHSSARDTSSSATAASHEAPPPVASPPPMPMIATPSTVPPTPSTVPIKAQPPKPARRTSARPVQAPVVAAPIDAPAESPAELPAELPVAAEPVATDWSDPFHRARRRGVTR